MLGPTLPSSTEVNNRALMVDLGSFFTLSWLQPRALSCLHAAKPLLSSGLSSEAWTSVHSPCPYQQVSVSSWGVQGGGQDLCTSLFYLSQDTCCTLLWASEAAFLSWLNSPKVNGVTGVREPFLFQSSLPECQVPSGSFFLFLFLIPPSYMMIFLAILVLILWDFLPAFNEYFASIFPHGDVFSMHL